VGDPLMSETPSAPEERPPYTLQTILDASASAEPVRREGGIISRGISQRCVRQGSCLSAPRNDFHYLPEERGAWSPSAIIGRVGRKVQTEENLPPEEGFADTIHEGWKAVVIVVDPTDHKDGQKVAVEVRVSVGGTNALIKGLVSAINDSDDSSPYLIEVQPIFDPSEFWKWAKENKGDVTSVKFDLVAPNGLFGARNNLRDELKAANEQSGANEVVIELKNPDGLRLDSEPIHEAVDYAESTGGRITGKAKGKRRFSSTLRPKMTTLRDTDSSNEPLVTRAARLLSEILGH
jgi:hypothetical protein